MLPYTASLTPKMLAPVTQDHLFTSLLSQSLPVCGFLCNVGNAFSHLVFQNQVLSHVWYVLQCWNNIWGIFEASSFLSTIKDTNIMFLGHAQCELHKQNWETILIILSSFLSPFSSNQNACHYGAENKRLEIYLKGFK